MFFSEGFASKLIKFQVSVRSSLKILFAQVCLESSKQSSKLRLFLTKLQKARSLSWEHEFP